MLKYDNWYLMLEDLSLRLINAGELDIGLDVAELRYRIEERVHDRKHKFTKDKKEVGV